MAKQRRRCDPIAPPQPSSPTTPRSGKATNFFKWVGYIFSGLIVLGMLSNCNF